ncbi:MAG: PQQ-binding-like beta-propeller repeat protein [Acidobacteria bacterium]|nr:PQQ-binding-like beta-propeller repeat protein [Acidobacteriota bacterium]
MSKDIGFPTQFSREQNVIWRTPVRPGKSSPILTARHIFLTAFENGKLFTQCFDRKNGRLLWERAEAPPRAEVGNVRNEPASITAVTDGENVYAFFADFGLISYAAAGNVRWKAPLGPFTNTMGLAASPILAGEFIVLLADQNDESYIAAFDRRNGEIRWKTAREEKDGWATPLVYRAPGAALQILTASRGELGAHRVEDGTRTWSHNRLSPAIVASPVLGQDTVFTFGYGNESATPFSDVLAKRDKNHDGRISPDEQGNDAFLIGIGKYEGNRDGIVTKEKWDEKQRKVLAPSVLVAVRLERDGPRELWRYEKSFVGVVPSPLLYDGVLYIIKNGGVLTAFDAETGKVVKTGRLQGALGGYSASPVAADGKIFLSSEEGKVAVLRASRDWDVLTVNDLGEGCYATPALSGGNIYLRSGEALYCFGTANRDRLVPR